MMHKLTVWGIAGTVLWAAAAALHAAPPKPEFVRQVDLEAFRLIAVQHDGRFKTLDTLARGALRHMSSSDSFEWEHAGEKTGVRQDPVFTYLDMLFRPEGYRDARLVYVKEKIVLDRLIVPVKDRMDKKTLDAIFNDRRVSLNFLLMPEVRGVLDELNQDVVKTAKKVEALFNSAGYSDPRVLRREMRVLPPPSSASQQDRWYSIEDLVSTAMPADAAHASLMGVRGLPGMSMQLQQSLNGQWTELQQAWMAQDAGRVNAALKSLADQIQRINTRIYPEASKLSLEHWYYKNNKMMWTWGVYFLAMIFLLMGVVYRWPRAIKIGACWFALAFLLHTVASGIRWYLAGRIPNSNMFEAVTAAAWFGCAVALFLELGPFFYRRGGSWAVSWFMTIGGFAVWLGSLLIAGIPVDAWMDWPAVAIAALIVGSVGCMALVALAAGRQMAHYRGVPLFAASAVGMVALMCGQFMKNSLDSDIGRTMPVLNDLWLYVHTNMIIASYALIGLAFMTAALYLVGRMLTMSWTWDKAWPVWVLIVLPTLLVPMLVLPDIINRVARLFGAGLSPLNWPLTLNQIMSAWAPFLIVVCMYLVAAVVRLVWRGGATQARAVWDGLATLEPEPVPVMAGAMVDTPLVRGPSPKAGGAGESALIPRMDRGGSVGLARVFDGATMLLLELSFIMLWTGIIMGAIWADHSWGRPWGWDPKEVFALNTWIIFLILVHVRLKVADRELWTAVLAVIGTSVMMFNWVVVNFFIVGLHSYA